MTLKYTALIKFTELDTDSLEIEKMRNEFLTHPYVNNERIALSTMNISKEQFDIGMFSDLVLWLDEYRI